MTFITVLISCFLAAFIGTRFKPDAWYRSLIVPDWTPPDWVFAPVWTLLYILMALAMTLIWIRCDGKKHILPSILFYLQLTANGLWAILFFGLKDPLLSLIDLIVLLIVLALTMFIFARIRFLAAILLVPYFLWCCYALALNYAIYRYNY